jgi:hypothetical protein
LTGFSRFLFGVKANVPVFAEFLSAILFLSALAGIVVSFVTDKRRRIVAVLPIAYFAFGLSSKTADNPVYSTLVTPAMFLLGTLTLVDLMEFQVWKPLARFLCWAGLATGALYLGNATYREMFFFGNADTRLMAEQWIRENVPSSFTVAGGRYTCLAPDLIRHEDSSEGDVWVRSDPRDPRRAHYFLINRFNPEDKPLPLFRNFATEIYVRENREIERDWQLPVFQKIPSVHQPDLILLESTDFFRSPKVVTVSPDQPARKTLLAHRDVDDVWVIVRCGNMPSHVRLSVGGREKAWKLSSNQAVWADLKHVRCRLPLLRNRRAYRISATAGPGAVQVTLAVTPEEKGAALFQVGAFREALPWLVQSLERKTHPTTAAMAQICLAMTEGRDKAAALERPSTLAAYLDREIASADLAVLYGISENYLKRLPYVEWAAEHLTGEGFRLVSPKESRAGMLAAEETTNDTRRIYSPLVMLEPGCYAGHLEYALTDMRRERGVVRVSVLDAAGNEVCPSRVMTLNGSAPGSFERLDIPFQKPADPISIKLRIEVANGLDVAVKGLSVGPDPVAGVSALKRALGALVYGERPESAAVPAAYDLLMAAARRFEERKDVENSRRFYAAAGRACPNRMEPIEGILRLGSRDARLDIPHDVISAVLRYGEAAARREARPVDAVFSGGVRLAGVSLTADKVKAGEDLGMKLLWDVRDALPRLNSLVVWVHFVDSEGRTVFQGDHGLVSDLAAPSGAKTFGTEDFYSIRIPPEAKPGAYRIRVGLWIPYERNRLRVGSSSLPTAKRGVEIATVQVGPPGSEAPQ